MHTFRDRALFRVISVAFFVLLASGCAYVGTMVRQSHYRRQIRQSPSPALYKHLLDQQTFFVFGIVETNTAAESIAVIALHRGEGPETVVDVSHNVREGSFYALNLPDGKFRIVAAADRNRDGVYSGDEVVAEAELDLQIPAEGRTERIVSDLNLSDAPRATASPVNRFSVAVRVEPKRNESLYFPKGTLRDLNDPIFAPEMATLGLYQPAAFIESAPMMFYALEEDISFKVPVIFVHGIAGSPRDFSSILDKLDRRRYRPWFYYYPSGASLEQVSDLFYEIFLSGRTIPKQENPVVIVAHSMGGLVVRNALNRVRGSEREQNLGVFITIASPFGGHPAAARGANAPVVLPSWRNLDPSSPFIKSLHRQSLPKGLRYSLYYAYGDKRAVRFGEPSDGVVPVSSQLTMAAQLEATRQLGFDGGHVEVLHQPGCIEQIVTAIQEAKPIHPEDHLKYLDQGGYDLPFGPEFSAAEIHIIRSVGRYMDALVEGKIDPFLPELRTFAEACRGTIKSELPVVKAWQKLDRAFPDRSGH